MELAIASEGDGEGGVEEEKGAPSLLGAPLKGRSISTNSRSCKTNETQNQFECMTSRGSY